MSPPTSIHFWRKAFSRRLAAAMGCVLSAPVELIRVQRKGSANFKVAVAEMQGWRVNHEDAHAMCCEVARGDFWVLDGHGGDGAANYGAPALAAEVGKAWDGLKMPSDERIIAGFETVDTDLRKYVSENPEKDSGSTVVGAMISKDEDGTFSIKMLNCGDSRGVVVRGPLEEEAASRLPVRVPTHLTEEEISAASSSSFPMIAESVDHKPNHPTEKARIEAAGGFVSQEEPPRLDGNLAVSRGIGDFEYKQDTGKSAALQKCSCVPDIYECSGVQAGAFCILCCDGVWDVMSGENVAVLVREWVQREPTVDLGEVAAEIIRTSLRRNSRDNVTAMIIQFVDGTEWENEPDEMKNFEKLSQECEDDVRKQYNTFLNRTKFPSEPTACQICNRWLLEMNQCPCKDVTYCNRKCQKKGWKTHKANCSSAIASPTNKGTKKT